MSNGHLKEDAISLIGDPKATQHDKLNVLLAMLLDNSDALDELKQATPLVAVPSKWRTRILAGSALWVVWVSTNMIGYDLSIPIIIEWVKQFT